MKYGNGRYTLTEAELGELARRQGTTAPATVRYAKALELQLEEDREQRFTWQVLEMLEQGAGRA